MGLVLALPAGSPCPALLRLPAAATKTRRERAVGLPELAVHIVRQRAERGASKVTGVVFAPRNFKKALAAACAKAGVPRFTLRDLRHTYATLALAGTADAVAVQAALGRTDLRTTQLYQSTTLSRTAAASAAVALALGLPGGSKSGGHSDTGKTEIPQDFQARARSSYGQSTGLLSARSLAISCTCCAERCRRLHGFSHACEGEGSNAGGMVDLGDERSKGGTR